MERFKIDRALVGIRPDNHPEAYRILMELKLRGELVAWRPIDTAPTDNKRPLYLARFHGGELVELDFNGSWEYWQESYEMPHINGYAWESNNGIEEPTHWAYQDDPLPKPTPQPAEPFCVDEGCPHHGTKHVCINRHVEPVKDDRVCKICDGGPGNECACSCGMRVWDTSAEPVCKTCEGTKVDPGGLSICRTCGRQPATPEQGPSDDKGWQLVPKEPTYEMIQALWVTITENHDTTNGGYKAMLEAAPKFGEEE